MASMGSKPVVASGLGADVLSDIRGEGAQLGGIRRGGVDALGDVQHVSGDVIIKGNAAGGVFEIVGEVFFFRVGLALLALFKTVQGVLQVGEGHKIFQQINMVGAGFCV